MKDMEKTQTETQTFEGIELTDLTKRLLKKHYEKTGQKPKELLTKALQALLKPERP